MCGQTYTVMSTYKKNEKNNLKKEQNAPEKGLISHAQKQRDMTVMSEITVNMLYLKHIQIFSCKLYITT